MRRIFLHSAAAIIVLVLLPMLEMSAQVPPDVVSVVRRHYREMAEEISRTFPTVGNPPQMIRLIVGRSKMPTLLENAFIDVFQRSGHMVVIGAKKEESSLTLRIDELEASVWYRARPERGFDRTVRTSLEARWETGTERTATYVGPFVKETKDVVPEKGAEGVMITTDEESPSSFFERFIRPILLVTGTFLIVYLFFTVRS
jgi:hypothetical protein